MQKCTKPLKSVSALLAVNRESNIGTDQSQAKEDKLEEEPAPSSALLLLICLSGTAVFVSAGVLLWRVGLAAGAVQVLGLDLDDVVVIRKLACFARETEVGD